MGVSDGILDICEGKEALLDLIGYYIRRRRATVVEALLDFHPKLVDVFELNHLFRIIDSEQDLSRFENSDSIQSTWIGVWNQSWKCHFHGMGCELIHLTTGERFDWDMSDPYIFSVYEIYIYLGWLLKYADEKQINHPLAWMKHASREGLGSLVECLEAGGSIERVDEQHKIYRYLPNAALE